MSARSVTEWIGKSPETSVPARVKIRIIDAQNGKCGCGCGVKLGMAGEVIEFDHITALINGGENRESNLRALRKRCHKSKTAQDVAEKSTVARKRKKALGLQPAKSSIPGSKGSRWKRKIDGTVVPR